MGTIKRKHALTNTAYGVAGEARVAAELARCGIKVADPYWGDDEIDLLVLHVRGQTLYPIPVQVKTIQKLDDKAGTTRVQGLKKRYVERNPQLCLAIYHPATDRIWFIDSAERITNVYRAQEGQHKHVKYEDIDADDMTSKGDVGIRLDLTAETTHLDKEWLVPRDDASWLSRRIARASDVLLNIEALKKALSEVVGPSDYTLIGESIEIVIENSHGSSETKTLTGKPPTTDEANP